MKDTVGVPRKKKKKKKKGESSVGVQTHQTSSSQPYFMRSSSKSRVCEIMIVTHAGCAVFLGPSSVLFLLTLKLVLADVDEAGRVHDGGCEVVHHCASPSRLLGVVVGRLEASRIPDRRESMNLRFTVYPPSRLSSPNRTDP
jgi:hypothetical protein